MPREPDLSRARLRFFRDRGMLPALPSPWQLRVGFMAGLPVYLGESDRERELSRRTWLGQVPIRAPLQVLYSPSHLRDPTGLSLPARAIVRHLLCVFHEDAFLGYDLQLLHGTPGGLARLREAAERVATGRDPLAPALQRMVGGSGYHARLVRLAIAAERAEYPDPLDLDPRFATLVGFARFCTTLPDWPKRSFYGFDWTRLR